MPKAQRRPADDPFSRRDAPPHAAALKQRPAGDPFPGGHPRAVGIFGILHF